MVKKAYIGKNSEHSVLYRKSVLKYITKYLAYALAEGNNLLIFD
jgi:hypothetical protein